MKRENTRTVNLYLALAYRFLILFDMSALCRLGFYAFNHDLFQPITGYFSIPIVYLKAFIQQYNNRMIDNKLTVK